MIFLTSSSFNLTNVHGINKANNLVTHKTVYLGRRYRVKSGCDLAQDNGRSLVFGSRHGPKSTNKSRPEELPAQRGPAHVLSTPDSHFLVTRPFLLHPIHPISTSPTRPLAPLHDSGDSDHASQGSKWQNQAILKKSTRTTGSLALESRAPKRKRITSTPGVRDKRC